MKTMARRVDMRILIPTMQKSKKQNSVSKYLGRYEVIKVVGNKAVHLHRVADLQLL